MKIYYQPTYARNKNYHSWNKIEDNTYMQRYQNLDQNVDLVIIFAVPPNEERPDEGSRSAPYISFLTSTIGHEHGIVL